MQTKPPSSFCARAAIAAALAFGSTTVMAQEAAIPTIAPPTPVAAPAPAAAPAPVVVTQSNPVVQAVPTAPEPVAEAAPAPARGAARSPAPARAAARASAPAAVAVPAAAAPAPAPIPVPPIAQDPIVAPVVPAAPPVTADIANDGLSGEEAGLLALLAAAGLAGAGLLVARSRRKRQEGEVEIEDIAMAPAPVAMAIPEPEPVFVREPALERFARAAAPLPAGPVPAGDARTALLDRMVAAEPDEDNPYVSRKRRVRRARQILAQREMTARQGRSDQFDWRTYRSSGQPSAQRSEAADRVPVPYPI